MLTVTDDGVGYHPGERRSGVRNMAERAEALGGESTVGGGRRAAPSWSGGSPPAADRAGADDSCRPAAPGHTKAPDRSRAPGWGVGQTAGAGTVPVPGDLALPSSVTSSVRLAWARPRIDEHEQRDGRDERGDRGVEGDLAHGPEGVGVQQQAAQGLTLEDGRHRAGQLRVVGGVPGRLTELRVGLATGRSRSGGP